MGVWELLGRDNREEESNNLGTKCWNGKQMEIRNSIEDKEETQYKCFVFGWLTLSVTIYVGR